MDMRKVGEWAFLACVVIAILAGLAMPAGDANVILALLVLGIIVGLLNISEKETTGFLVAAIALLAASGVAQWSVLETTLAQYITAILGNIGAFVAPAAVIVALKAVWSMGKK